MKTIAAGACLLVLGSMLSGCGDGSGGGVASVSGPTYTKIADMTGNRTFQTGGVAYNTSASGFSNATTEKYGNGVRVAYTESSDTYTVTDPGGTSQSFGPTDQTAPPPLAPPPPPNTTIYTKVSGNQTDRLELTAPTVNGVALSYTVIGSWQRTVNNVGTAHIAIGGAPTITSDMPKTGTASYATSVLGVAVVPSGTYTLAGNSTATFSANFATGAINTSLALAGAPSQGAPVTQFGTYTGTGSIDAGGPGFSGTLFGPSASGVFSGLFLGPQAQEMGYGWALTGNTFSAAGAVVGVKQ